MKLTTLGRSIYTFSMIGTGRKWRGDVRRDRLGGRHRRRMEREAKAVASVWGADLVQFLATIAVLPRSVLKKRLN